LPARAFGATAPAGKGSFSTDWRPKAGGPQPPAAKTRNSRCSCRPSLAADRKGVENGKL